MKNKRRKKKSKQKKVTSLKKSRTKIEAALAKILDKLEIPYKQNVPLNRYCVDFLVNESLIVECYGDFWHCNPKFYDAEYYNKALKCQAQDKWSKDANRRHILEEMGYRFIVVWETDLKKHPKEIIKEIKGFLGG